jgi:hypothetical protein
VERYCRKCMAETERYADGRCKPCAKLYNARWEAVNREKRMARRSAYCKANREGENARRDAWRKANHEKHKATEAAYRASNHEHRAMFMDAWKKSNHEKIKSYSDAYISEMPEGYIANVIRKSNKLLKQVQIPAEMIESKRAELRVKRLIKEMKK